MSDTPRTDAAESTHLKTPHYHVVGSVFARQLEREITDAHCTIESLRATVRELVGLLEGAATQNAIQRAKDLLP